MDSLFMTYKINIKIGKRVQYLILVKKKTNDYLLTNNY